MLWHGALLPSSLVAGIRVGPGNISQKLRPFFHLFIQQIGMEEQGLGPGDEVMSQPSPCPQGLPFRGWGESQPHLNTLINNVQRTEEGWEEL